MITVLIAGIFGFLISLTALPVFIKKMKSLKLGQLIREEGPAAHQHKAGPPPKAGRRDASPRFLPGTDVGQCMQQGFAGRKVNQAYTAFHEGKGVRGIGIINSSSF